MQFVIRVGNLADSFDNNVLRLMFESYGVVTSVDIGRHFETGKSTGAAIVKMASKASGELAVAALDESEHSGRKLSVCREKSFPSGSKQRSGVRRFDII